jgi:hypothetical protein
MARAADRVLKGDRFSGHRTAALLLLRHTRDADPVKPALAKTGVIQRASSAAF